jgi:nucleoside-diphosphate-sugar epimerase
MTGGKQHFEETQRVVCVTGATGMIGSRIARRLADQGYSVRVLARGRCELSNVRIFKAGLADESRLEEFVRGAEMIFHCAAELKDATRMHETNVVGTSRLMELAIRHKVRYFCHISSAGVIGKTTQTIVDEDTPCRPQNAYEKSKFEAEQLFQRGIGGCKVVILRPTNVVDSNHLGDLGLAVDGSITSMIKAFIKGGECAHLIHAGDVASAALHFIERPISTSPRTYFVSCDADPLNTVSDLWRIYKTVTAGSELGKVFGFPHLPVFIPYALRFMSGRPANRGDVRYSAKRIESEGFRLAFGVRQIVQDLAQSIPKRSPFDNSNCGGPTQMQIK